jgi:hypothetical protein
MDDMSDCKPLLYNATLSESRHGIFMFMFCLNWRVKKSVAKCFSYYFLLLFVFKIFLCRAIIAQTCVIIVTIKSMFCHNSVLFKFSRYKSLIVKLEVCDVKRH